MTIGGRNTLSEIVITDSDLTSRALSLDQYLPRNQTDWAPQIAAGRVDALSAFEQSKGDDPAFTVPQTDSTWQRVLAYTTLAVIFEGTLDRQEMADDYRDRADKLMENLRYRVDSNEDGTLQNEELSTRVGSVRLLR